MVDSAANSNQQKKVNVTAPTSPPSTMSSGSLSPKPATSSSSMFSSGQHTPAQGQDQQPLHDASASLSKPPLPATTLSAHKCSQKQVYRDGMDTLTSSQRPYHLPPSISNPTVQTKSKTRLFFFPLPVLPPHSRLLLLPLEGQCWPIALLVRSTWHCWQLYLQVQVTTVYEEHKGLVEYNVVFFKEDFRKYICGLFDFRSNADESVSSKLVVLVNLQSSNSLWYCNAVFVFLILKLLKTYT